MAENGGVVTQALIDIDAGTDTDIYKNEYKGYFEVPNPECKTADTMSGDECSAEGARYNPEHEITEYNRPVEPDEGTYARFKLDELTPGKYRFYERSVNASGQTACNVGSLEYDLLPHDGTPKSPWLLSLMDPDYDPDLDPATDENTALLHKSASDRSVNRNPRIRVFGVTPGNEVSLHLTNHCNDDISPKIMVENLSTPSALTDAHKAQYMKKVPDGQSYVDLKIPAAAAGEGLAPGIYLFRAKTRNFYGWSRCSLTGTYYSVLGHNPIATGANFRVKGLTDSSGVFTSVDVTPTIRIGDDDPTDSDDPAAASAILGEGDTVALYYTSSTTETDLCKESNRIGSGTVAKGKTTVEITVNARTFTAPSPTNPTEKPYKIYAKITQRKGSPVEFICSSEGTKAAPVTDTDKSNAVMVSYKLIKLVAPSVTSEDATTPNSATIPEFTITAGTDAPFVAGDRVKVYNNTACTGTPLMSSGVLRASDIESSGTVVKLSPSRALTSGRNYSLKVQIERPDILDGKSACTTTGYAYTP